MFMVELEGNILNHKAEVESNNSFQMSLPKRKQTNQQET